MRLASRQSGCGARRFAQSAGSNKGLCPRRVNCAMGRSVGTEAEAGFLASFRLYGPGACVWQAVRAAVGLVDRPRAPDRTKRCTGLCPRRVNCAMGRSVGTEAEAGFLASFRLYGPGACVWQAVRAAVGLVDLPRAPDRTKVCVLAGSTVQWADPSEPRQRPVSSLRFDCTDREHASGKPSERLWGS